MAGARSLCLLNQNPEASQDKVFRICRHLLNYCFTARKVLRVWRKLKPKETAPVDCGGSKDCGPPGRTGGTLLISAQPALPERDLSNREKSHILTRLKLMLLISSLSSEL